MKGDGAAGQAKAGDVLLPLPLFALKGVMILPEVEIQAVLKSWLEREVGFDESQKADDEIQAYCRRKGYTAQAILPPQKIAGGVVKILITEAKLGKVVVDNPWDSICFSNARAVVILNETPVIIISIKLESEEKMVRLILGELIIKRANEIPFVKTGKGPKLFNC